jgi:hypothetical protein
VGIHQAIQYTGKDRHYGEQSSLAESIQSDRLAVPCLDLLAEKSGIQGIVFGGHDLDRRVDFNIFHNPDVSGNTPGLQSSARSSGFRCLQVTTVLEVKSVFRFDIADGFG